MLTRMRLRLTPLNGFENSRLEGFGKPGVHGPCLLPFTVDGLEIVETTLSCDLALELPQPIEGHARSICSVKKGFVKTRTTRRVVATVRTHKSRIFPRFVQDSRLLYRDQKLRLGEAHRRAL
jgi:hypothetical protein